MDSRIVRLVIDAVASFQDKVAVVDGDGNARTTYLQLLSTAVKTLEYIRSKEIAAQRFITIELPENASFIGVQMGVWLARCVSVPVGIAFPDDRKAYIAGHCDAALNIDGAALDEILALALPETPLQDMLPGTLPQEEDDALLIYTSGSTGNPKGVLHDHRSLMNAVEMMRVYNPGPDDRLACGVHSYFIAQLFYLMMVFGTEVHILPGKAVTDIVSMADYHREHGISIAFISATTWPYYQCGSERMRVVFTGSDRVRNAKVQPFRLINVYGQTETAGPIIWTEIGEVTENAPIGLPVSGVEFAVLDDDLNPVPYGQEGELCLRGHFAKGIYKDEVQTGRLYRGGWLHTGDLVKQLEDGRLQYVNRKDWMVKVNGQRVEPGEVENAMLTLPGIKQAVVKGFDNGHGSMYLAGYYTLKEGQRPIYSNVLKSQLDNLLPHYMVPSRFVYLESFPLNANGKIDRKSLQAPAVTSTNLVPLKGATEQMVAGLFCRLLGIDIKEVGATTSFFEIGGDSVLIMKLCAELNSALDRNITPVRIYDNPTVRGIAHTLDHVSNEQEGTGQALDYVYSSHPDKAPLVFIHTGSTGSEAYYALAADIKDCCSFSVIEQYNIFHPEDQKESIHDIAAKYIEIMKARHPEGPYNLGGWCYGGVVAYEMACQLKEAGEDMGSLIMIDAFLPMSDYDRKFERRSRVENVDRSYYERSPLFAAFRERGMLEQIIANSRMTGINIVEFRPKEYNGRVHFFKAMQIDRELPGQSRTSYAHAIRRAAGGFEQFIPEQLLTIYEIPENHDGMMSETGRKVISNRIRNIMETEILYLEAERLYKEQSSRKQNNGKES